eukprot:s978_g7.t2
MRVYIHPYTVVILFALDRGHAAWVLPWQSHVAQHKTKSQAEWSEDHEMGCGAAALRYHQAGRHCAGDARVVPTMRTMRRLPCRKAHGAITVAAIALTKGTKGRSEEVEVPVIKEEEVRRLNWAERVAGRRFEDFLGRDAFGPAHLGHFGDCGSFVLLSKLLAPYKLGRFQAAPPSAAAQLWPDVDGATLRLRLERADGRLLQVFTVDELKKYEKRTREVTHKCTTSGNLKLGHESGGGDFLLTKGNQQEWTGVWVGELLPKNHRVERGTYDPLVTFVGMDGFGYSMFLSRTLKEDVILAYEQNGEALTTETGGPVDDDEDLEEEKGRRKVTPPAEILSRDFSSMLTLSFRGEGLKDGERSFLVVYTKASGENLWTELGKTEVCSLDTTWPVWGTIMELEFRVEVIRHMRCEAYKMASSDSLEDLWHHKFIGACEFTLTEAVTSRAKAGCWPR